MRMLGTDIQLHGSFELHENELFNHGFPFSLNVGSDNGESYTFLKQKLTIDASHMGSKLIGSKLIGSSLTFVFKPEGNGATSFLNTCNFKIWKLT